MSRRFVSGMKLLRVVGSCIVSTSIYGALLFVPAGTLHWWRGWSVIAIVFVAMVAGRLSVFRDEDGLLAERRKPPLQRGQPFADKLLVVAFLTVFPAYIAFIPLDVFRFHLFDRPQAALTIFGLALFVAGLSLIAFAFRENAFAAAIVRHQYERGQIVIRGGVYAVVRHPLYSGVGLIILGSALWLESYASEIVAALPLAVLVVRINVEESFLKKRLPGYGAYMKAVRKRLIPYVW